MTFCKGPERRVANSRAPLRVLKSHATRGCSQLFPPLLRPFQTHTHARSLKYFAWLCTILVNFYRQDLRRSSSSALVYGEDLSEVESASPTPSEEVVGLDEAALVKKAVGLLSPPLREVVALYYFDGLGLQELANILGLPLGTVKFRLHAARKKLCEHVTRLFGEKRDSL